MFVAYGQDSGITVHTSTAYFGIVHEFMFSPSNACGKWGQLEGCS